MTRVLEDKQAKTRKTHQCYGCQRSFPAGSKMRCFNAVSQDNEIYSLYFCEKCDEHSKDWSDEDWEVTRKGDIGYWKGDGWYPVSQLI